MTHPTQPRIDVATQLTHDRVQLDTRRLFLQQGMAGLGAFWLAGQGLAHASAPAPTIERNPARPLAPLTPHFAPKAKRVIFLHMAGAPSQLEMFSHKPELAKLTGQDCPQEYIEGKRFAFIRGVPQLLGPVFPFHQEKQTGMWISDQLPHFERVLDKVSFIHTMQSDQFNHAPGQLLMHTGNQNMGYPSLGSWLTYGLGSECENLPGFVVLLSGGRTPDAGKSVWGSGFLPSVYQGVQCRSEGDPVLYLSNPDGIDRAMRAKILEAINKVNAETHRQFGDPETVTRISQYEMAYKMQLSATDAMDMSQEPAHIHEMYGTQPGQESFANNCLLARRLAERGVRFVQLYDWGWDSHGASQFEALNGGFKQKCQQIDRPISALLTDLEQRGLLDETLVVWGSEFGRTPMRENRGGREMQFIGRDHHPYAYTIWMAGGGVKRGHAHGETDPIGYYPVGEPTHIRDFLATMWHLMGFDHEKFVFPYQGLNQKITGVKPARVVKEVVA
jgi:hypothetical protein